MADVSRLKPGGWRRLRAAALDFLLPPVCAVCGREGGHLCGPCLAQLRPATGPRCALCWTPDEPTPCAACRVRAPAFQALRASFVYEGALRDALLALKFRGVRALAEPLAEAVDAAAVLPAGAHVDVVCAIPMPGRRRRARGYDQAAVLGRALAGRLQLPFDGRLLRRARSTGRQSGQADVSARRRNVRGAFRADASRCAGRSVLVVDDITTSAATLEDAARALRIAGAGEVYAWALARED